MAIFSFKLKQLFILLVPELVVLIDAAGGITFPSEVEFVQKFLSIKSNFVIDVVSACPL